MGLFSSCREEIARVMERIEQAVSELCQTGDGDVCFDADGVLWREDAGNEYLLRCITQHLLSPEQELARTLHFWGGVLSN